MTKIAKHNDQNCQTFDISF